jgi:hypothetical protein
VVVEHGGEGWAIAAPIGVEVLDRALQSEERALDGYSG